MDNRQEFIEELASAFGQQAEAEALLAEIRYPHGLGPRWQAFPGAAQYWAYVYAEIENGRLPYGGLEVLAEAARAEHPANHVFRRAAEHGRHLRTFADRPVASPGQDAFGFLAYADVFSILINDKETATPLTVAVSGPWGSGKTSLAQLIEARLKVRLYWRRGWDKAPITCWFNAWMHSDAQYLGAALAASVTRQVGRQRRVFWKLVSPLPSAVLSPEQRAWRRAWTWLVAASLALLAFLALLRFFPELRPESGKLGQLYGHWNVLTAYAAVPAVIALFRSVLKVRDSLGAFIDSPRSAAAQGTIAEVDSQLGWVIRQAQRCGLGRAKRRVVIFIDDLERCPVDKALDICEVVSQLLSHVDVVTVLVADLDILELAANARFLPPGDAEPVAPGFSEVGEHYLNKLIQFRFNLPPADQGAVASAIAQAGQNPASPASGGLRSRLPAAQKWVDAHQVVLGVAGVAVAVSAAVAAYFVVNIHAGHASGGNASGGNASVGHGTVSHGSGSSLSLIHIVEVFLSPIVALFDSGVQLIESLLDSFLDAFTFTNNHVVSVLVLVGVASAAFAYRVAKNAISRMWMLRRSRIPGSVTEIARLVEYDSSRKEAENEIATFLPANLRRAKRLINHLRLYALMGEYRGIFGGDPELTRRHLAKWVLIVEHWPRLGAALTRDPAMIAALEQASDVPQLQQALDAGAPGIRASGELLQVLEYGTSLSPVLARLVRFEAPAPPRGPVGPEAAGKRSDGGRTRAG